MTTRQELLAAVLQERFSPQPRRRPPGQTAEQARRLRELDRALAGGDDPVDDVDALLRRSA